MVDLTTAYLGYIVCIALVTAVVYICKGIATLYRDAREALRIRYNVRRPIHEWKFITPITAEEREELRKELYGEETE